MFFRRAAEVHVLEIGEDLLQKFPVDLVGGDGLVDVHQLQDQAVIGGLGLVTGTRFLNIAEDVVGRNVVAALGEVALQNAGVLLHIFVNELLVYLMTTEAVYSCLLSA